MEELVGEWSSEASGMYHSAFEDETFAFLGNGDGWYQFSRPDYADLAYFQWRQSGPDEVELSWRSAREIFGGVVTEQPPEPEPARLRYRVSAEDTPLAGRQLVLRLTPPIGVATEFGLVTRTPTSTARGDRR